MERPGVAMPANNAVETQDGVPPVALTMRQKEVLRWLCEGKTNWEIGKILGTTQDTAKYHVAQIFLRLNVVSRAQAVAKALQRETY
jgi:LuxR family transcriptional regulator, quorum-sensing system regulator CviR